MTTTGYCFLKLTNSVSGTNNYVVSGPKFCITKRSILSLATIYSSIVCFQSIKSWFFTLFEKRMVPNANFTTPNNSTQKIDFKLRKFSFFK
jgi:hypothetical protein